MSEAVRRNDADRLVTRLACYVLMASAFVLSGLLLSQSRGWLENKAEAALLVNRDDITLMTAQTRNGEESLFVLDNRTERLFVYRLDVNRRQMAPAGVLSLAEMFATPTEEPRRR